MSGISNSKVMGCSLLPISLLLTVVICYVKNISSNIVMDYYYYFQLLPLLVMTTIIITIFHCFRNFFNVSRDSLQGSKVILTFFREDI